LHPVASVLVAHSQTGFVFVLKNIIFGWFEVTSRNGACAPSTQT
jgi:hypothetical protein